MIFVIQLGLSDDSVIKCMVDDGIDPTLMPEFSGYVPPNSTGRIGTQDVSASNGNSSGSIVNGTSAEGHTGGPILVDNKYVKYLNMIKVKILILLHIRRVNIK